MAPDVRTQVPISLVFSLSLLLASANPVSPAEPGCSIAPDDVFAKVTDEIVEVFAIAINPYRVVGRVTASSGTAFFIDGQHLVTNYHVIVDAADITVFSEDRWSPVAVVGADPSLDIAVLRPLLMEDPGGGMPFFDGELKVGQTTYAIGYPLHIGKSLSVGRVSGTGRVLPRTTSSWLSPFIQTDAAISPGNSGGPLMDSCGRVIGMVAAGINAPAVENIGLAIPASVLRPIVAEIIETGRVARAWHGLYGQIVSPPILLMLGVPEWDWESTKGFLVETVEPGSAAARVGLRGGTLPVRWGGMEILLGGDIITHVNGKHIETRDQALDVIRGLKPGDRVDLVYLRDGERMEASVDVEERPVLEGDLDMYRYSDRE